MKRVTDPLDDRVKAQIVGHRAQVAEDDDLSSSSFSEIVFDFPEHDAGDYSGSESDLPPCNSDGELEGEVEAINCGGDEDSFRNVLASRVSEVVELLSSCLNSSKMPEILRRHVMAYLRDFGYNAGVCKTKWERSDGITAGDHEFIDVLQSDSQNRIQRYIVNLEFSSEFEIARPTNHFEGLIRSLPKVFVGKSEELKKILKVMSKAAKRSFKSRGLHLPPWRKQRFMENKWFGSYRRNTNFRPASTTSMDQLLPPLEQALAVKCRSVGFDAAVNRQLLFPVVTRTR